MKNISHAKAQRRKENPLETRQRFASLRLCARNLFLLLILISLAPITRADGGVVICQQTSAAFKITMFSTEMPLRPGPVDLSVLLERTGGYSPILDAQVFMELEHESGTRIYAEATRTQARNKLLYCSLTTLPKSGRWKMTLHVIRGDEKADMLYDFVVAAPPPVLLSNWKLISLPPLIIILFIINQWLLGMHQSEKRLDHQRD